MLICDQESAILWEAICWRQILELGRANEAVCRCSVSILLVLTQEGPAVLEVQEKTRSRRDAGATDIIASTSNLARPAFLSECPRPAAR